MNGVLTCSPHLTYRESINARPTSAKPAEDYHAVSPTTPLLGPLSPPSFHLSIPPPFHPSTLPSLYPSTLPSLHSSTLQSLHPSTLPSLCPKERKGLSELDSQLS